MSRASSASPISSARWLPSLCATAERIAALTPDQSYTLYTLLHETFQQIARVDAFYVCLYAPREDKPLWFVYNVDQDNQWEEPGRHALSGWGEGPTSTVIHSRRPYVLDAHNASVQNRGVKFGEMESPSLSALHIPILVHAGTSREEVLGVLSAQAYQPNVYTPDHVRALQWLADYAADWLHTSRQAGVPELQGTGGQGVPVSALTFADAMVPLLSGLRQKIETVSKQIATGQVSALSLQSLDDDCRRLQADLMHILWRREEGDTTSTAPTATMRQDILSTLTARERTVLEALRASGDTDAVLARRLGIQVSTLKFHLRNLYNKMGVENRTQAVQSAALLALPPDS